MAPSPFRVDRFLALKHKEQLRWGTPFHFSEHTTSSNDDALRAAKAGAAHGSLFVTDHQSRGRGRQGKSWESNAGASLLFSVLLRPNTASSATFALTLAAGLGVREGLSMAIPQGEPSPFELKWPNDIVANGRKLGGLLCEGHVVGDRLEAVVIGVGINVFDSQLTGDLADTATSLAQCAPENHLSREPLLARVLCEMQKRVNACLEGGLQDLVEEFRQYDALSGKTVLVHGNQSGTLRGTAMGIDDQGRLLLQTTNGVVPVVSGTVRLAG